MRHRFFAAAAATALVALPLVACADDDEATTPDPTPDTDDAADRISDAASATLDDGTAAYTITVDTGVNGTPARGDTDTDTGTDGGPGGDRRTETDPGDTGVVVEPLDVDGDVDFDDELRRMTVSRTNGGTNDGVEVIVDGTTAYVQRPAAEDEYAEVDVEELIDDEARAAAALLDPVAVLRLLEEDVTDAHEGGTEQLDATDSDRYTVTVDADGATVDDPALQVLLDRADAGDLELVVWLDEDGDTIAGVEMEVESENGTDPTGTTDTDTDTDTDPGTDTDNGMGDAHLGDGGTDTRTDDDADRTAGAGRAGTATTGTDGMLTVTMEFSDLGEDVTIEVPEGDDVVDADTQTLRGDLGLTPVATSGPDTDGAGTLTDGDDATNGTGTTNGTETTDETNGDGTTGGAATTEDENDLGGGADTGPGS